MSFMKMLNKRGPRIDQVASDFTDEIHEIHEKDDCQKLLLHA